MEHPCEKYWLAEDPLIRHKRLNVELRPQNLGRRT